jgi:Rrf2 family transcriptional regulator, nitric oxide-sensitive transcriptional repressor
MCAPDKARLSVRGRTGHKRGMIAMRLTTRTDLAMRTLMFCALNPGRTVNKQEIATACKASENHLAQVIHLLARHGFVVTQRGRSGGLRLARPPEMILVGEVFRTFEAVLPFAECDAAGAQSCPLVGACRLHGVLHQALAAFYAVLDRTTLRDLVSANPDLAALLVVA